jgi:GT2 family glycosyltransferase
MLNQVLDAEFSAPPVSHDRASGEHSAFLDGHAAIQSAGRSMSGACLLVRCDTFLEVGRFTEAYFMYAEDIDLCFKLKSAGKQNYYLGNVSVVHHGGQSSNASSESQFGNVMMRESIAKFLRLHRGARYALAYRVALAFTALARLGVLGLARLLGLGLYKPRAVDSGLRKWNSVLRWAVGAETWVHNLGAGSS